MTGLASEHMRELERRQTAVGFSNIPGTIVGRQFLMHGTSGSHNELCNGTVTGLGYSDQSAFLELRVSAKSFLGHPLKRVVVIDAGTGGIPRYVWHAHVMIPKEGLRDIKCEFEVLRSRAI